MKILLVAPPLSSPAGPYPAIAYLAGFLRTIGREAALADAGLAVLLRLFSADGIHRLAAALRTAGDDEDAQARHLLEHTREWAVAAEIAVGCLQGDAGAVVRAQREETFPSGGHERQDWAYLTYVNALAHERRLGTLSAGQQRRLVEQGDAAHFAFGDHGADDRARYHASRFLDDLTALIARTVDPAFAQSAYAEGLADEAATFAPLRHRLDQPPSLVDTLIDEVADALWDTHRPDVAGFSVPFGGTLYGALRMARRFKQRHPAVTTVMGGGWPNTQLRQLADPGVFDVIDYITLDDGERPLQCLLEALEGTRPWHHLLRTYRRREGRVEYINAPQERDVPFAGTGTPAHGLLPRRRYLTYAATPFPFCELWGRRWNKLTLAHGCYWKKCTFCDTQLDYIAGYAPAPVDVTIDRIKRVLDDTGERGFHFVDEAMPPKLMGQLAERLIAEGITIAWWGNARFDRALGERAALLAASGCVAITGGLEVASERVLALIDKGITLEQAAWVCHALTAAGIHTHAYLIYGYPTQTAQETVDALEYVRQMFEAGALRSAHWARFGLTAYSPISARPADFQIIVPSQPRQPFANYELRYTEPGGTDHAVFSDGLKRAVEYYRLGLAFHRPVPDWFDSPQPAPTLEPGFVSRSVSQMQGPEAASHHAT